MTHAGGRPKLPPGERRVRVTLTLPPGVAETIRVEADRLGVSASQYVERVLGRHLEWP